MVLPKSQESVRVLGAMVDMDGGARKDTTTRIEAASQSCGKLKRPLLRAGLTLKAKGQIVQAVIVSSLLYACEARAFLQTQVQQYQTFIDRVIRGVVFSCNKITLANMEGRYRMQDLRNMVGISALNVQIEKRQLAYLGHLGRYPSTRLEKRMLHGWLACDGLGPPRAATPGRCTLRNRYTELIQKVRIKADITTDCWKTSWEELAQRGDPPGKRWREITTGIVEELEIAAQKQTWKE